jgi:sulfite reductase alpha subunit-like flavoprotein
MMIYVVYGSQSGNSEEIAKRISKEIKENKKIKSTGVEFLVMNKFLSIVQKFPENKMQKNIIIGVCSTTGSGDAPTNCENFVRWIKRKTLASDTLSNAYYTILGLGDSNYTKYQHVPKMVDEGLSRIGAKKFYQRGEADDAYGLEIVVEPWIEGLYPVLENLCREIDERNEKQGSENNKEAEHSITKKEKNLISTSSNLKIFNEENKTPARVNSPLLDDPPHKQVLNYLNAKIFSKTLLSGKKSEKELYSIKIHPDLQHKDLTFTNYEPGTYISIIPQESPERLSIITSVINIKNTSQNILIDKTHHFNLFSDFHEKFPHFNKLLQKGHLTYDEVFKYIIDFDSVLKKSQVLNIKNLLSSKLSNQDKEKESNALHTEILNKFNLIFNKYTEMILRNKISLYDILRSLSLYKVKLNMELSEMIECFPIKYPRNYSLASYSYNKENNPLEIVFSVVHDRIIRKFPTLKFTDLPLGIKSGEYYYYGQTTNFLRQCKEGDDIFICEIGNCFNFPMENFLKNKKPILYICHGTGITPCISFIKKLLAEKEKINKKTIGELIILTGFRSASIDRSETVLEDFINEAIEILGKDVITYLRCVSVCSEHEEEEMGIWRNCRINTKYVQDLILENEDKIHNVIFKLSGYVMICGDIEKLYDECIANIMSTLMKKESYTMELSKKYVEDMKSKGRLILEKWS